MTVKQINVEEVEEKTAYCHVHDRQETAIELVFKINGQEVPSDHGYLLYTAISAALGDKWFHALSDILVAPINGYSEQDTTLIGRNSCLRLRCQSEQVPQCVNLAGSTLTVGHRKIHLSVPRIYNLKPFSKLYSKLVLVQTEQFDSLEQFGNVLRNQMRGLGISNATIHIPSVDDQPVYYGMTIKNKRLLGHPVILDDLKDEDSIVIQASGLGGKRKMGCGFFVPAHKNNDVQTITC